MEIEYIRDMDELDNVQKLMVLQNAKDLLKYLHEAEENFPYDVYFEGTEKLKKAMAFVDDELIHGGYEP